MTNPPKFMLGDIVLTKWCMGQIEFAQYSKEYNREDKDDDTPVGRHWRYDLQKARGSRSWAQVKEDEIIAVYNRSTGKWDQP